MIIKDFGMPFNDVGSDRLYSAADWSEYFKNLVGNGVVGEVGNELAIIKQTVANKTIQVSTGTVVINGAMRVIDAAFNLTIADNTSGNPRIDRIVARLNQTDRKLEIVVKQGTAASSPSAPALTQTSTVWEISLAKIAVANGFSTVITANITDERSYMTYKDRVLNDRMTGLEGDVDSANTRMDGMDPAKYYGKYSQMSGGNARTGKDQAGAITFSTEDNDDFSAINGTNWTKIIISAALNGKKAKFYWYGSLNPSHDVPTQVSLYKNGVAVTTMAWAYANNSGVNVPVIGKVETVPISLATNDYFEARFIPGDTVDDTLSSVSAGSIFGMEVLG